MFTYQSTFDNIIYNFVELDLNWLDIHPERWTCVQHITIVARVVRKLADKKKIFSTDKWLLLLHKCSAVLYIYML